MAFFLLRQFIIVYKRLINDMHSCNIDCSVTLFGPKCYCQFEIRWEFVARYRKSFWNLQLKEMFGSLFSFLLSENITICRAIFFFFSFGPKIVRLNRPHAVLDGLSTYAYFELVIVMPSNYTRLLVFFFLHVFIFFSSR